MNQVEQLHNQNRIQDDHPKNKEFTGTALTRIVSFLVIVFTVLMFYSFWDEVWEFAHYVAFTILSILTLSIIANTISPKKCWWGFRLVSLFIFCAYSYYLLDLFIIDPKPFELFARQSKASPINALLGFLIIGIPALVYTFSGSTFGNHDPKSLKNTKKGTILFKLRVITYRVLMTIAIIQVIVIIGKLIF